jgi:hypothetical protein
MFTGWIYDHLQPHASALKVAHPLMLRAIAIVRACSQFNQDFGGRTDYGFSAERGWL